MIPILVDHDHAKPPIGIIEWKDNALVVTMKEPTARVTLEAVFGQMGFRVLEYEGTDPEFMIIKKFEILEFSLCPGKPR